MKHTKTPWRFTEVTEDMHDQFCSTGLVSKEGVVAKAGECQWTGLIVFDKEEDMDFILHAANNYDRLIKALKKIEESDENTMEFSSIAGKVLKVMGES